MYIMYKASPFPGLCEAIWVYNNENEVIKGSLETGNMEIGLIEIGSQVQVQFRGWGVFFQIL